MTNYITKILSEEVSKLEWVTDSNNIDYLKIEIDFVAETTFHYENPGRFTLIMKKKEESSDFELIMVKEQFYTKYSRLDYEPEQAIFNSYKLKCLLGSIELGPIPNKPSKKNIIT